jgi:hypothetical protein
MGMEERACLTPLGAVARRAAAGALGAVAMDLLWFSRYRHNGGDSGFIDWEFSAGLLNSWDGAPALRIRRRGAVEGAQCPSCLRYRDGRDVLRARGSLRSPVVAASGSLGGCTPDPGGPTGAAQFTLPDRSPGGARWAASSA